MQKAIDTAAALDLSIYNVTIQIADGTYTITSAILGKSAVSAGEIWLVGNETTLANVLLTSSTAFGSNTALIFLSNLTTTYWLRGIKFQSTTRAFVTLSSEPCHIIFPVPLEAPG